MSVKSESAAAAGLAPPHRFPIGLWGELQVRLMFGRPTGLNACSSPHGSVGDAERSPATTMGEPAGRNPTLIRFSNSGRCCLYCISVSGARKCTRSGDFERPAADVQAPLGGVLGGLNTALPLRTAARAGTATIRLPRGFVAAMALGAKLRRRGSWLFCSCSVCSSG